MKVCLRPFNSVYKNSGTFELDSKPQELLGELVET